MMQTTPSCQLRDMLIQLLQTMDNARVSAREMTAVLRERMDEFEKSGLNDANFQNQCDRESGYRRGMFNGDNYLRSRKC